MHLIVAIEIAAIFTLYTIIKLPRAAAPADLPLNRL